jgi:hypothetical protein
MGITLEQLVVVLERTVFEAERYLRIELEDNFVDSENRDIRQDTENLLGVILQFIHLTNRIHALETQKTPNGPAYDIVQLANQVGIAPSTTSPHRAASTAFPSFSSAGGSRKREAAAAVAKQEPTYLINYNEAFCDNAFLASTDEEMEHSGNQVHFPLKPKCPHLKCLVRRVIGIFNLLEINPLHLGTFLNKMLKGFHSSIV